VDSAEAEDWRVERARAPQPPDQDRRGLGSW